MKYKISFGLYLGSIVFCAVILIGFLGVFGTASAVVYCAPHSYQQCLGNNLYWYDSCGNQQELSQYCQNGCFNNQCQQNYNPTPACTYHAYRLCLGNNLYWYDSCGNQQDLFQTCYGADQTCQYGQCVYKPPVPPYVPHSAITCYGGNLHWYDSLGRKTDLYKNCSDSNSCTIDACAASKCFNTLKCDGSACAVGSADYSTYCAPNKPDNNISGLAISFFAKPAANSNQWQKTLQVNSNGQAYFMINLVNNGYSKLDGINVSANIPGEVSYIGNLKIDNVSIAGDIISGIGIGSLASMTTKVITFEGKSQTIPAQTEKQATATVNVLGTTKSDSILVNLNPVPAGEASVSSPASMSGIWNFLKRWYLWILVGLVLVFLFIVVFRKLSSNA